MISEITIAPINSLLFLSDPDGGEPPMPIWGARILSTPSCISFACYPAQDGPTKVRMGRREEVAWETQPAFEGELETPHKAAVISTVDLNVVMKMDVPSTRTHVTIWVSDARWPERIAIGLS